MRQLTCEMTEEQKEEFCSKYKLDRALLEDNCPCPKVDGIAIFPENKSNSELQLTVQQLTTHLAKMTEQLNLITSSLKSNQK
jgi:hypothetical protein